MRQHVVWFVVADGFMGVSWPSPENPTMTYIRFHAKIESNSVSSQW